ncbi:LysR family transcriptional regulator [Janthinobacterium agaricidamnosum]|uniref:Bacterial regulatory helix-turn-helix, lysR family protein n=1 Tax=Janthinobacterium agaricidamnosum NBRC 102515 = DSM 9628 TaxID=1349767 RepID=W0VAF0_9BURK|nr:LysR family transcriptional regulator [Janthinobacterium agaricidamnosum]CDG85794.1 bacterial regulatory helix-turn-helix, lysR family protein [Janthinobacterium agaricidamnosum NBRC 102515 = DSM 9628]
MLFEDLRAFVAVIDHNSLTRAAEVLSLTQSAVSRRIQHLEEVLDAELFDRNSRPPQPTALARRVYEQALPLMLNARRLLDISRDDLAPAGSFRVGLTQAVGEMMLFDVARRLRSAFPALDLKLHTEWSTRLQEQLAHGGLDAVAVMKPSPSELPARMDGRLITTLPVVVVQSKQTPLVARDTAIAQLAEQEWILNPVGCGYRAALERAMAGAGRQLNLRVDTIGTELQLRLVAAGMGLGLVPRSVLHRSPSLEQLTVVDTPDFAMQLDVWVIHTLQMGNLRRAADLLCDVVTECLATQDAQATGV